MSRTNGSQAKTNGSVNIEQIKNDVDRSVKFEHLNVILQAITGESLKATADPIEHKDAVEAWADDVNEMAQRATQAEEIAVTALKVVRDLQQERSSDNDTAAAERLARDELIRRASTGVTGPSMPISRSKVIDMAKPDRSLAHAQVARAFENLETQYDCFYTTESQGKKSLSVDTSKITTTLAIRVAASIGRPDVAAAFSDGDSQMLADSGPANTIISETAADGGK